MAVVWVLLADEDADALAFARRVLTEAGYAVAEASNGRRAIQQVMASPPDVLITEILMPEGDGIELISAVKGTYPAMRIIAVAERRFMGGLDLLDLATKLGADATLDKPIGAEKLLSTVATLVGSAARLS